MSHEYQRLFLVAALVCCAATHAADGDLDTAFGSSGKAILNAAEAGATGSNFTATDVATQSNTATAAAEAAGVVVETLQAQREAISGVSLDEEAINLMRYQRAFQGAARVVTVVDELMQTMLGMVR